MPGVSVRFDPCDIDPCGADCSSAPCNPECGGDPCSPGCLGGPFPCDDPCAIDPCSAECAEAPCNPECGGDPCAPGCGNPPCHSLQDCDDDEEDEPEYACVGDIKTYSAPDCPAACREECVPEEWEWTVSDEAIALILTNPPVGDSVDVLFIGPGIVTLTATNECCTWSQEIYLVQGRIDVARIAGNFPSPNQNGSLDDERKLDPGAFLPLNNDDDDYSATGPSNSGADHLQTGAVDGDNYLLPIMLKKVEPEEAAGEYTITIPAHVRVWESPDRTGSVTDTTIFPADEETTLYIEGIAQDVEALTLSWSNEHAECPNTDRVQLTVFNWQGPLNVPGYAAYHYIVSGDLPAGAGWSGATDGATVQSGQGTPGATILWGAGPTVSRMQLTVNEDYWWELEVNVVRIDVGAGQNGISYTNPAWMCGQQNPLLYICFGSFASGNPGMSASVNARVEGPIVGASPRMRGARIIQLGFIQDATVPQMHGRFDFENDPQIGAWKRVFSLEGTGPHPDVAPTSTAPWYDSQSTWGTRGFHAVGNITQAVNVSFNTTDSPDPRPSDLAVMTQQNVQDLIDWMAMRIEFKLYFAVRTTATTNGASNQFAQRGYAQWVAEGSGAIDPQVGHLGLGSANSSGSAQFQIITSGASVPIGGGPSINTLSNQGTYSTVPVP